MTEKTITIVQIHVLLSTHCVYVMVQFYPWFKFYFLLFLGIVMYDNEFETKENKIWTKDKIDPQHIHHLSEVNCLPKLEREKERKKQCSSQLYRSKNCFCVNLDSCIEECAFHDLQLYIQLTQKDVLYILFDARLTIDL